VIISNGDLSGFLPKRQGGSRAFILAASPAFIAWKLERKLIITGYESAANMSVTRNGMLFASFVAGMEVGNGVVILLTKDAGGISVNASGLYIPAEAGETLTVSNGGVAGAHCLLYYDIVL
jgi:hypothetical protein